MARSTKGQQIGMLIDAVININRELRAVDIKETNIRRLRKESAKYRAQVKQEMLELGYWCEST